MGVCLSLCPSFSPVCLPAYTYLPNDQSVSLFVCLLLQSGLSLSLCVCGGQLIRSRSGEKHSILGTSSAGSGASQAAQAGCPLPSLPFLSPASLPAPHTILLLCSSASGCSVHNLPQLPFIGFLFPSFSLFHFPYLSFMLSLSLLLSVFPSFIGLFSWNHFFHYFFIFESLCIYLFLSLNVTFYFSSFYLSLSFSLC